MFCKTKNETLWTGNVFVWLLPPFRSCIKLLKLNSCQFTSKQLGSHWCCLSRGASSTQQVSTYVILIQIIASLRLQYNTKVLGTIKRTFQLRTPLKRANSNTLLIFWTFWSWFQFPDHKIFSLLLRICIAVILLAFELRGSHKKELHFWRAPCMYEWPDFHTPISNMRRWCSWSSLWRRLWYSRHWQWWWLVLTEAVIIRAWWW